MSAHPISVEKADAILKLHLLDFGVESLSLENCMGRILREDIYADLDMPSFHRVSMDGIAMRYVAYEKGIKSFGIQGMAAAGSEQQTLTDAGLCLEIMTGSILPLGADTIIPYEWLEIKNGSVNIIKENVLKGQNIHRKGTDRKQGDLLITSGRRISSGEIGILAAAGKKQVQVSKLPRVIVISTGDELVEPDIILLPHQVRMSNVYQLHAALQAERIVADKTHLKDDYDLIFNSLKKFIHEYDVIIIIGGVSAGKFDFVPTALISSGVEQRFYKVKQRPGKPFWFGNHLGGCTVFAIPGNPVSSMLCYIRYVRPWLEQSLTKSSSEFQIAKLAEDVTFAPDLTYFLPVRIYQDENAEVIALPVKGHGSGDLTNLGDTDAFIELPAGRDSFRKGEVFQIHPFRN